MLEAEIKNWINSKKEEIVKDLIRLVRIESISKPDDEIQALSGDVAAVVILGHCSLLFRICVE